MLHWKSVVALNFPQSIVNLSKWKAPGSHFSFIVSLLFFVRSRPYPRRTFRRMRTGTHIKTCHTTTAQHDAALKHTTCTQYTRVNPSKETQSLFSGLLSYLGGLILDSFLSPKKINIFWFPKTVKYFPLTLRAIRECELHSPWFWGLKSPKR